MAADQTSLASWCLEHLGSAPSAEIFRSGHLSEVIGIRLADGRDVVVKTRPNAPRIHGCVEVQRHLFRAGYPCPQPVSAALAFDDRLATAEAYVPGEATRPTGTDPVRASAEAFARLIELAPRPDEVATLAPPPSWANWNYAGPGLWPPPEDADVDPNRSSAAVWIDEVGRLARDRLAAIDSEAVIGHCDWLADNLRWAGADLLVVHDWDSLIVESEAVLVGFAAALFSPVDSDQLATVAESERFLDAYGRARQDPLSPEQLELAWAAGVWTRANDAKFQASIGAPSTSLSKDEARERLRRAGTDFEDQPAG